MKYFIPFMLFFLTNCFAPTTISAMTNAKNLPTLSNVKVAKKLNFKERVALKWLAFKPKTPFAKDAILPLALSLVFLILGILLLISSFGSGGGVALFFCIISFSISLIFLVGGLMDAFG